VTREHQDFEKWYASTHPRLLSLLVVTCGDLDLAREATDEAFVRALERWDRVRRMAAPEGWTYRVALNVVRRRARRSARERELVESPHPVPPPASAWNPDLWAAVRSLPDRERLAIALRYVADLPAKHVAEVMGIAEGTVWSTLASAKQRLRDVMTDPKMERGVNHG
jgi:RNA polymerase sigma-70 factor (ECF subfamily)